MPQRCKPRNICHVPDTTYFKPAGIPLRDLTEVSLAPDEVEALRLCDLHSMYHGDAAEQMGVSRQTLGRLIKQARHKVAKALINGMALRLLNPET